jgi:hypothetical protein
MVAAMKVSKTVTISELGAALGVPGLVDIRHNYFFGEKRETVLELLVDGEPVPVAKAAGCRCKCNDCGHTWEEAVIITHLNCPKCAKGAISVLP